MGFNNSVPPGFMPPDNGPLPGFGGSAPAPGSPFQNSPGFVPVEVVPDQFSGKPPPQVPFVPAPTLTPFVPHPQYTAYQPTKSSGGCLVAVLVTCGVLFLSCLGGGIVIAKVAHRIEQEQQRQREFDVGPDYSLLPDRSGIDEMRGIQERMRRESEQRMEEMRRDSERRVDDMRRWSEENRRQMREDLERVRLPRDF